MDTNKVNELLSKINYPGFSRDIVSFGMVNDIQINSDNVINGAFEVANRLYGLKFDMLDDIQVWHKEVKVYKL